MPENLLVQSRSGFLANHPEQTRILNGRKWGYIQTGSIGPCLLLLPGTLGRADVFWQQIEALQDKARIISLSYPEETGIENWASDIVLLLEQENWTGVTVLGSSLGGYLAQYLINQYPDGFSKLIAANTLCDAGDIKNKPPYSLDISNIEIEQLRKPWAANVEAGKVEHPERSDMTDLLLAEINGRIPALELKSRLLALKHAPKLIGHTFAHTGTYSIEAEDDPLIPAAMRASVRSRINPVVAYEFLEGGHFPYLIRAEAYTSLLKEILGLAVDGQGWGEGAVRKQ